MSLMADTEFKSAYSFQECFTNLWNKYYNWASINHPPPKEDITLS